MGKFVLDTNAVSDASNQINTFASQLDSLASTISGFQVDVDDIDFSKAINAIKENVKSAKTITKSISSAMNKIVEEHTKLQQSLKFEAKLVDNPPKLTETKKENKYTVKKGDTLSEIARDYGTTVAAIVAANNIKNANLIYPGEEFIIPNEEKTTTTKKTDKETTEKKDTSVKTETKKEDTQNNTTTISTTGNINYSTSSVDGNRKVAGSSGYTMNEVLNKIKNKCEEKGLGDHWTEICAISLWETGNYTSVAFKNNNVGGLSYADGSTRYSFESLDSGIDAFVSNLKNNYYDQGLTTLDSIGRKYCPGTSSDWTSNVNIMKRQIERCI